MNISLILIVTLFLLSCSPVLKTDPSSIDTKTKDSTAQEDITPSPAKGSLCEEGARQKLWRIDGDSSTVYMFGSIHFGIPAFYPFSDEINQAFEKSQYLVVEINSQKEGIGSEMAELMKAGYLSEGETLEQKLSPEVYNQLEETLSAMGVPIAPFLHFRPWMMAVTLSVLQIQSLGYSPEMGVESYFFRKSDDKEILELESAEYQMKLLSMLDGEDFLSYTILSGESAKQQMQALSTAWACGDSVSLASIVLKDYSEHIPGYEQIYEEMFKKRNHAMARRISELAQNKGVYFVVVGAGHFLGEDSIISILAENGWVVKSL
ncbi:TraB/GumN family protein [Chitinispirillales bacterium ANBcel5]|uniref:TraB/GumN family protein n=1 Tax=Cellulosispirillum alkaliphilum TaxID=3039283 RepID=UPI002A536489|nr:TraB/GumN family protein [Chitinispirillales bacterium ANBcel5]